MLMQKTQLSLGIVIFEKFQVIFTVFFILGNPVSFLKID